MTFFCRLGQKWYFFEVFLDFFQKPDIVRSCGFLRCVQCIKALLLSYKKQFLDSFSYFSS